jgi:hypothetical protein
MKHLLASMLIGAGLGAGSIALLPAAIMGHEHWIDMDYFYPEPGDTIEVYISSGHYFPESDHVLKDDVIDAFRVLRSGDEPTLLESSVGDNSRVAVLAVSEEGVHILHMRLKRPRAKKPSFEAKAILIAGGSEDSSAQYPVGEGLELIPLTAISLLRPRAELPILLALDGRPITGSLEIVPEHGKSAFFSTTADSPAIIPIRTAGRYLITAHAGGRGCSLVLEVRQRAGDDESKLQGENVEPIREEPESDDQEERQE